MTYKYLTVGNEWTKHRFSRKDYLVSYQLTLISRLLLYKIYVKEDTDLSFTRL
jgi:hypothetical protein